MKELMEVEGVYYSSGGATKKWVLDVLTRPIVSDQGFMETLNNELVEDNEGEVLWCIHEIQWNLGKPLKWIGAYRLYEIKEKGWGFTKAAEITPPQSFNCPLDYLGLVEPAHNEWRIKVYQYHAEKDVQKLLRRSE